MTQIQLIDTTLRDGQQSMWALNMRTGMMMPALADMDAAGFEAIEFFLPTQQLKKMVRDLREDPWQWMKAGVNGVKKTPLRLHGGYKPHSFSRVPASVGKLLNQKMAENGFTVTRTSHQWNDYEDMQEEVDELRKLGIETIVNLIYSVSPRHTDEYFVERAKSARAIKPYRICFKDVGGLLTPERIRELLPKIIAAVGDVTLEFHGHCNNGLGPLNILEVVRQGITHIHTAIPPLANGSSQPSVFNVEKNLKALGYEPDVDVSVLRPVEAHFTYVAKMEGLPIGIPAEWDQSLYHHQVPGGMISNLEYQLRKVGMENRLEETLEESIQVRAEFGYPIMVTPLSQFVGSQAAINVIVGERYKEVTDETIQYALGYWGKEAVKVMDPEIRAKILDRPRTEEFLDWKPVDMPLDEVRKKYGKHLTDEELILRVYVDEEAVNIARKAPPPQPYLSSQQPLVQLVQNLTQVKGLGYISIQKGDCALVLNDSRAPERQK